MSSHVRFFDRCMRRALARALTLAVLVGVAACGDGSGGQTDVQASDIGTPDSAIEVASDPGLESGPDETVEVPAIVPPRPPTWLAYPRPVRVASGTPPTAAEVSAFTEKMAAFYTQTGYLDWVWRMSHGLDASYDPSMPDYKLWWQDVGMRREGDAIVLVHHGKAENIAERIKTPADPRAEPWPPMKAGEGL